MNKEKSNSIDDYDRLLLNKIKSGIISLDEYVELKNCSLLNIKKNIELLNKKNDIEMKNIFIDRYNNIIKCKDKDIIYKNKIILNRLLKKSNIEYTDDQKNAIHEMIKFITNDIDKYFGLFGFAGTGKTTVIIDFLMNCIEMKYINTLVFTASTNKALNVIKTKISDKIKYLLDKNNINYDDNLSFDINCDKLKKKNITIEFQTIHKLLKYKTEYSIDGDIIFTKDKDIQLDGYDIIVIDECSMISLNLVYDIIKESEKIKTKIIFTGDHAQLPPVNENISSVFMTSNNKITINKLRQYNNNISYEDYDKFCYKIINMNRFVLKQIIRTNNYNIIKCSNTIRDWIYNIDDFINIQKYEDKSIKLYSFDKSTKIKTEWFKEFEKLIQKDKDTIIIGWTNKEVNYYNNYIRTYLFQNIDNTKEYVVGDILILNEFYILNSADKNQNNNYLENKVKFNTSEKIICESVEEINYNIDKLNIQIKNNIKTFQNHRSIQTKYKNFIEKINLNIPELKCYHINVKKIDENKNTYTIYVLKNEYINIHKILISGLINSIKDFRTELYEQYKLLSIDDLIIQPLYNEFYSKFINPFASVSYGYSITCHKAQGSSYKNVFVDFSDIVKNNKIDEMKRCTYTAISRTINNLYILV